MFTDTDAVAQLVSEYIHRLENTILMHKSVIMWFKPVEVSPQEFFLCLSKCERIPEGATFSTKTDPSPRDGAYLALHGLGVGGCRAHFGLGEGEWTRRMLKQMMA